MQSTPDRQLLSNYSHIFAIDINTNIIDEDKISVSVIYVSIPKRDNRKEGIYFFLKHPFIYKCKTRNKSRGSNALEKELVYKKT